MGFHWSTPTGSRTRLRVSRALLLGLGRRGAYPYPSLTLLSWDDCRTLGEPTLEPLDRRGFHTRGSFLEKVPSERVGRLLCAEDGHAFLGGFLEEVERVLQRQRRDETFRPWAGAVNAARAHVRLAKKESNHGSFRSLSIKCAGFSCLLRFAGSPSRFCYISTRRALRLLTLPFALAFLVPVPRS
jgi:hypothetical protein